MPTAEHIALYRELSDAITYGELMAQHVPRGHPLDGAIDAAREWLDYLEDGGVSVTPSAMDPIGRRVKAAIAEIYAQTDTIRTDPTKPLPPARWTNKLPMPYVVGGLVVAALVVGVMLWGDT